MLHSEEKWSNFFYNLYSTNKLSNSKLKICQTCKSYFKQRPGENESFTDLFELDGGVYIRPLSTFMIRDQGLFQPGLSSESFFVLR